VGSQFLLDLVPSNSHGVFRSLLASASLDNSVGASWLRIEEHATWLGDHSATRTHEFFLFFIFLI
jgi:hypothetical protein